MPPAPQILAEMNAETLDAASAIHPSPAVRLIREFGTGALAGVAAGALAGLASRIVMRISGFAAGPGAVGELTESGFVVGEVTLGGTLALVLLGAIGGALGGAVYVAMRPWLAPLHRWRGIGFGLLMLAVSGEPDPASRVLGRLGASPRAAGHVLDGLAPRDLLGVRSLGSHAAGRCRLEPRGRGWLLALRDLGRLRLGGRRGSALRAQRDRRCALARALRHRGVDRRATPVRVTSWPESRQCS